MGTPFSALSRNEPAAGVITSSPLAMARLAGLLYLLIAAAAAVTHAYVPAQLIVAGDVAATVGRIGAAEPLFRLGIAAEYVILLSEVALCVLLYALFRPLGATLALMMVSFRLVMTAIHGANMLNQFVVLNLSGEGATTALVAPGQQELLVALFLDAYQAGFAIGIVFLVPHVFLLGYLVLVSGFLPRPLGLLLLLAGCGYLIDSIGLLALPGYTETPAVVALIIAVAEIAFPLWLLFKGIDGERWRQRAAVAQ